TRPCVTSVHEVTTTKKSGAAPASNPGQPLRKENTTLPSTPTNPDRMVGQWVRLHNPDRPHTPTLGWLKHCTPIPGNPGLWRWVLHTPTGDRKSTRLNSSHVSISYPVFCLHTYILT